MAAIKWIIGTPQLILDNDDITASIDSTMTAGTGIPFHIQMRRLYRGGEGWEHELSFGPVGVVEPAIVVIASNGYDEPAIAERLGRGVLELPDRLVDALAIQCYRLMSFAIIEQNGESGWWTLANASPWLRREFVPADAERILKELSRHVTPGVTVRSVCRVADDDAI